MRSARSSNGESNGWTSTTVLGGLLGGLLLLWPGVTLGQEDGDAAAPEPEGTATVESAEDAAPPATGEEGAGSWSGQERRRQAASPGISIRPVMPIVVGRPSGSEEPAEDGNAGGQQRSIEISTPPPEQGAAEFGGQATGLIRTDTFEAGGEEGQPAEAAAGSESGGEYQGIIPGSHDTLPDFSRYQRAHRPYVTWVGFQPVGNGRVFVQLTQPTAFNLLQVKGDLYHLEIQDARLAFRNGRRPMDASYFQGNLQSVTAQRYAKGTRIVIQLKKPARPSIRQQGLYLYLDIP